MLAKLGLPPSAALSRGGRGAAREVAHAGLGVFEGVAQLLEIRNHRLFERGFDLLNGDPVVKGSVPAIVELTLRSLRRPGSPVACRVS